MDNSVERALPSTRKTSGAPSVRGNRDEPAGAKVGERTSIPCALTPTGHPWRDLEELLRGLPDWIAWRLEAFVVLVEDRSLSPDVLAAIREKHT